MQTTNSSIQLLRSALHRIHGGRADLDSLIDLAGDAGFVVLGEATHGTHEFYATRAAITQRLVAEKSFQAVGMWRNRDVEAKRGTDTFSASTSVRIFVGLGGGKGCLSPFFPQPFRNRTRELTLICESSYLRRAWISPPVNYVRVETRIRRIYA
jgi:hypothetical protein